MKVLSLRVNFQQKTKMDLVDNHCEFLTRFQTFLDVFMIHSLK